MRDRKAKTGRRGLRRALPIAAVVVVGLLLTAAAFAAARSVEQRRLRADFDRLADDRMHSLEQVVHEFVDMLYAMNALYAGGEEIDRARFSAFVASLLEHHHGVQAFGWIPHVPAAARADYERAARQDGFAGFEIWERDPSGVAVSVAEREAYYPVYFIEPPAGNERALGFDLASEPTRRAALARAVETGDIATSAGITLVQETGHERSVLIALPRYAEHAAPATIEQRRQRFEGFFTCVLRVGDTLEGTLSLLQPGGVDLLVTDESAPPGERVLAVHDSRTRSAGSGWPTPEVFGSGSLRRERTIDVGGRTWRITCVAAPALLTTRSTTLSLAALSGGLLVTALLAALVSFLGGRREARAALLDSETRYRGVVEDLPDLVCRYEPDTTLTFVNEAYARYFGRKPDALIGTSFLALVPAQEHDAVRKHLASIDAAAPTRIIEHRVVTGTGEVRWQEWTDRALLDAAGTVVEFQSIGRDVTEQRQAQEALRESEERYRTLVEHAPEAIVVLDLDTGRFVDANANAFRLFGLEGEDLLAVSPVDLSPPVQPDGRTSREAARAYLEQAAGGDTPSFEWTHRDHAGREFPCDVRLARLPGAARCLVRGSITDITERKQSEARQKLLMQELDHRVKNNLAAVIALAEQSFTTARSPDEFRESYLGRVRALARNYDAMVAAKWKGVDLSEAVRLNLEAFVRLGEQRIRIDGDHLLLPARASSPMYMALHELTTNAVKHGALSSPGGCVEVKWSRADDDSLDLLWTETGGPPTSEPTRTGFGTTLIKGVIEHEMRGTVHLDYRPQGLVCTMSVPLAESS